MLKLCFKTMLSILFIFSVNHTSMAITGEKISNQVDQWLLNEGVIGKSVFSKKTVFKDCKDNLNISKAFQSYSTIRVNCPDKNGLNIAMRVNLKNRIKTIKSKKIFQKQTKKNRNKVKKSFKLVKLKKTLEKRSILKFDDLELISSNKSTQTSFFNNINQLVGRKLKQNLKMGQLLHPRHLYEQFEIKSGDFLSIVSNIGKAVITVSGEAQNSGNLGDLIKVKNLRSGKIIKGYIQKNKIIKVFR